MIDLDDGEAPVRGKGRASRRPLGAAAALLLVLAAGGAASLPRDPPVVASSPEGRSHTGIVLTDDALYTTHRDGTVRARALRPGGPEWTLEAGVREPVLESRGRWLMVVGSSDIGLVDPRTGEVRRRTRSGEITVPLGDRVVVWQPGVDEIRVVDPATGGTVWTAGDMFTVFDADERRVAGADFRGHAVVLDAATGGCSRGRGHWAPTGRDSPPGSSGNY